MALSQGRRYKVTLRQPLRTSDDSVTYAVFGDSIKKDPATTDIIVRGFGYAYTIPRDLVGLIHDDEPGKEAE